MTLSQEVDRWRPQKALSFWNGQKTSLGREREPAADGHVPYVPNVGAGLLIAPYQNTYFKANCRSRISVAVVVTLPKLGLFAVPFGSPQLG